MLFDYLQSILCNKKYYVELDEYIPFLVTRWLSFGKPELTPGLNESVNCLSNLTKEQHYKLLLSLVPKYKYFTKINYIKKPTTDKTDKDENNKIQIISRNLELSKREIIENQKTVDFLNTFSK